jgi:transposase-like protein
MADTIPRGHRYSFLIVDALVLKIREHGAVRPGSGFVMTGMTETGY